ncbi:hypothetical protein SAMN04487881_0072 [Marinobacter sp. es.048]|uniref:hypothetical protein n=1 Tax=Marinobacter sp. es.048 TaxID=1761795 RepID=UPI000B587F38|nr:hypothetical protein [Marinobacter sp. es.048]SNC59518.1 hypothetical protein SAMN04487881_0072 [Marinobacter sp. es.048]
MKSNELLDKNGTFKVPFFHGTSSLFLPHIHRHGLGGLNMVRDSGWIDAFGDLFEFAEKNIASMLGWARLRDHLLPILEQGLGNDCNRHHYRHGETCITSAEPIARQYAFPHGCELLF